MNDGWGFFDFRLGNYFRFLRSAGFRRLRPFAWSWHTFRHVEATECRDARSLRLYDTQPPINIQHVIFLFLTTYQNVLFFFFLVPGMHQMKQLVIRQRQSTLDKRVQILERTGRP